MAARYQTFALKLPSGRWVEVRRPSAAALLGQGVLLSPLLSRAVSSQAAEEGDDLSGERNDPLQVLKDFAGAILVRPAPEPGMLDAIPFADLYALYSWGASGAGETRALGDRDWAVRDFQPMVAGTAAIHLDLMCARYGVRPSVALGVAEADCAVDLDMAVAYRGLKRESDASSDEVVVEDPLGGKHKVPKKWLPVGNLEPGAEPMQLEARARELGGNTVFSAGGVYGDGKIDVMPRPGSADRAPY